MAKTKTDPKILAVRSAAGGFSAADRRLRQAILDAYDDGRSLREIGAAAGISHEQVRRIVRASR